MVCVVSWSVRGVLFADYVKMIRGHKTVSWADELAAEDLAFLSMRIEPNEWYPMATFERLGNAIFKHVAGSDLNAVRMWGRFSVDQLRALQPSLLAGGDAIETMRRFRVLRSTYFDFDTLDIPVLFDEEAEIVIHYRMGRLAEEAAAHQTLGFFERLLELSDAKEITSEFLQRTWGGDPTTRLRLTWKTA
jgi:hypothetical protein